MHVSILHARTLPHQPLENRVMRFLNSWVSEESLQECPEQSSEIIQRWYHCPKWHVHNQNRNITKKHIEMSTETLNRAETLRSK